MEQQRIDVTVAAVIERDERFLLVEERVGGRVVLNQPAGHVEMGESLLDAVIRETLEETGFEFHPRHVVGIYSWHCAEADRMFLRTTFCGTAQAPVGEPRLDDGIIGVQWLKRSQLVSRAAELRSPLVMRCIDDYLAGARFPLACVAHVDSASAPARASLASR